MTFLFDQIVFGPVNSRRLGNSLGINLLPTSYKYCTFNCVYCECGWTHKMEGKPLKLPGRAEIFAALENSLISLQEHSQRIDAITFAGNGEPTIHPEFPGIVDDTVILRDKYFPDTAVAVLSNSSTLHKPGIFKALGKVDKNILKLDTGIDETFRILNQPAPGISLDKIVEKLKEFNGKVIIQSLFLRGIHNGVAIDNSTENEISEWIGKLREIKPVYVMIYSIDRATPEKNLEKLSFAELVKIAETAEAAGIRAQVFA